MSQYPPPPPSFRGPFHSNVQMTSPSSNPHHVLPQYPYQSFRDPNNPGPSSTQYAAPYSYNTTGQNIGGSLSLAGAPRSPYVGFGQATNGSFPPPSYPPIPPPFGMFQQPVLHQREPSLGSIQPHNSLPLKPPPVAQMMVDINSEKPQPVATNSSELEDGELSDRESGRDPKEIADTSNVSQRSATNENDAFLQSAEGTRERSEKANEFLEGNLESDDHPRKNINHSQDKFNLGTSLNARTTPIQKPSNPAKLDHTITLQSTNYTHKMDRPGGLNDNHKDPRLSHLGVARPAVSASGLMPENGSIHTVAAPSDDPRVRSSKQGTTDPKDKWRDIREQAEEVLRELHPLGVRFVDYVNAGIDPDILRKLYASIGMPVDLSNSTNQISQGTQSSTPVATDTKIEYAIPSSVIENSTDKDRPNSKDGSEDKRMTPETAQVSKSPSSSLGPKAVVGQDPLVSQENINSLENKAVESRPIDHESDAHIANSNSTLKPFQITKAPKQSTNIVLGKSTIAKPGDKVLERKDYIARMLAAKASKPISVINTTLSPKPSVYQKEPASQTPASGEAQLADADESRRVCIGNLPYAATEGDLRDLFTGFLSESISIPINLTEKHAGYGYVELSSAAEAQRAISELSGQRILDRTISVQLAPKADSTAQTSETAAQDDAQAPAEVTLDAITKNDSPAKAIKKAQTELARQKIEALKNRKSNAQNSHGDDPGVIPPNQGPQVLAEDPQPRAVKKEPSNSVQLGNASESMQQGLFYKPVSHGQAFNIPGLFMDSGTLESSKMQLLAKDPQKHLEIIQGTGIQAAEPQDNGVDFQISHTQPSTGNFELSTTTSAVSEIPAQPTTIGEPRKRQKAADFIDSPSIKIKRPLGQNTDTSVIIEVSEDEADGDTENENNDLEDDMAMDIEVGSGRNTPLKNIPSIESGSIKQKTIRDLPPLSDFPGRKKTTPNVAVIPPSIMSSPSRGKEPQILKTKEKEIELMNRRIAELEQRIKAKQSASRAQTPGTPGGSTASPKLLGNLALLHEKPRSGVGDMKSSHDPNKQTKVQHLTNDVVPVIAEDVSDAAGITHYDKVAENAEAAKIVIEAANAANVEIMRAAKAAKDAKDAEAAEAAKVAEQERVLAEQRAKALELAEAERLRAAAAAEAKAEEQRQARRAEIESGLPVLDAEMERTKLRLRSLRDQMQDLENEVKKGVDGRRVLMEELMGLSASPNPSTFNQKPISMYGGANHVPEAREENHVSVDSSFSDKGINLAEAPRNANYGFDGVINAQDSTSQSLLQVPSIGNAEQQHAINKYEEEFMNSSPGINEHQADMDMLLDINQHQEDIMDTSPDGPDDGEITDYGPDPLANLSTTSGLGDTGELCEPPTTADTISVLTTLPPAEDFGRENALLQTVPNVPLSSTDDINGIHVPEAVSNSFNHAHVHEEQRVHEAQRASTRSSQFAERSDSDDYEPPEPAPPVEKALLSPVHTATNTAMSQPTFVADTSAVSRPMLADSVSIIKEPEKSSVTKSLDITINPGDESTSNLKSGQFTPYESPLKQFKSYRYHAKYDDEISQGFRSLTYSHNINPDKPVCRFETAGGVCNDDSCDGQHFRNMSLSDDMVLVQMGAIPEGLTTEEGDAYANGLRRIIQAIRGRKVRDFDTVAREITEYRASFLSDKLQLLPS